MASKQTKECKEINEETISKEEFLDVFNLLVKIESDIKTWAKQTESQKKKDREEQNTLMAEIEKLKIEKISTLRINLMTQDF